MSNQDKKLIKACIQEDVVKLFRPFKCDHPLDSDIRKELRELGAKIKENDDDYEIFRHRADTDRLWGLLLEKAIKCLRFYDSREPFKDKSKDKKPRAYGIDDLKDYYRKYTEFEEILYGSNRHYRDHVVHVLRTWLSGMELLTKNRGDALKQIKIHDKAIPLKVNNAEKISMWTIIALTHDLGYPLQKAKGILDVTQDMLSTFITNPDISVDFAFHGVQNYMNDFVVRLMSSKMEKREKNPTIPPTGTEASRKDNSAAKSEPKTTKGKDPAQENPNEKLYIARLQSKYYFKFQKSLERNSHGILSTLIIYKLLTYFLESDYNINEDYSFTQEECRQFYIRREILRAIASHTCDDIYQMYMGSFSFLLRICDDTQEWGRKNISELYVKSGQEYELQDIGLSFSTIEIAGKSKPANSCTVKERISVPDRESAIRLVCQFRKQAIVYVTIFRDGQDTDLRDFSFSRTLTVKIDDISLELKLDIDKDKASQMTGTITYHSNEEKNKPFGQDFSKLLTDKLPVKCDLKIFNQQNQKADLQKPATWSTGKLEVPLIN